MIKVSKNAGDQWYVETEKAYPPLFRLMLNRIYMTGDEMKFVEKAYRMLKSQHEDGQFITYLSIDLLRELNKIWKKYKHKNKE